jgi:hypothetical protein
MRRYVKPKKLTDEQITEGFNDLYDAIYRLETDENYEEVLKALRLHRKLQSGILRYEDYREGFIRYEFIDKKFQNR